MVIEFISLLLTMAALQIKFLFLKGMTGALAPFNYLVVMSVCFTFVSSVANLIYSYKLALLYHWKPSLQTYKLV